ncbi:hypothetical protein ACVWY3_003066 [Bradyrhizobium sp. USDA 4486]
MLGLARALVDAMETSWLSSRVNINDGVEALRALEAVTWRPLTELVGLTERLSLALIGEALRRSVGKEAAPAKGPKPAKKPKKASAGQKEMLMPIEGKKPKDVAAKKPARKSA